MKRETGFIKTNGKVFLFSISFLIKIGIWYIYIKKKKKKKKDKEWYVKIEIIKKRV